jgi:hypothetical protein
MLIQRTLTTAPLISDEIMNKTELQINKIAQGFLTLKDGIDWFDASDPITKKDILQSLSAILTQSHPTADEVEKGINRSELKRTYTPCVLMAEKPFSEAVAKIRNLPDNEWRKTFILWISIFSIADKRRRKTECLDGCAHEWHNIENL